MVPYDESFVVNRVSPTFFDLYQKAGRVFGDDPTSCVWPSRVQYDICAGLSPESSLSKHATECEKALGLYIPPAPGAYSGPIRRDGRWLVTDTGKFHWRGATSFRLAHMVVNQEDIAPWLDWCVANQINLVRVASMCQNMFSLSPADGLKGMEYVAQVAKDRGIYVEAVGILDSALISVNVFDQLNQLCSLANYYGNVIVEGANEPHHSTQRSDIPQLVKEFATSATATYACGASHGEQDENREFLVVPGIEYGTIHTGRHRAPWGNCRHTREIQISADELKLYEVSDEPERSLTRSLQFGYGAISRVGGFGDTYHSEHGKYCRLPDPTEQGMFDARRASWESVPKEFEGRFTNFNWADHPLSEFHMYDDDSRAYSRVTENEGYVALTHADNPVFRNGWQGMPINGVDEGNGNVASVWKCTR